MRKKILFFSLLLLLSITSVSCKRISNKNESKEVILASFTVLADIISNVAKYDYEVPVIAVEGIRSKEIIELPRISPRLKDDQLKNWFQKNINTILKK